MHYIFNFALLIEHLPIDTFRLIYLDSQNDGTSQDYTFRLRCFSAEKYDVSHWGLKKAVIYFHDKPFRYGVLTKGKAYEKQFEGYYYEFILSSPLSTLKTLGPNRVFVSKSAQDIIDEILRSDRWQKSQWRWQLKQPLPVLPYVVQYHQSDFDLLLSLLEEFQLNFKFEHNILVLSDEQTCENTTHHVEKHQPYVTHTSQTFLGYDYAKSPRRGLFTAIIESSDENTTYLDHQGYYTIRFPFDKTSENLHGSLPVPFIAPHFMHFPLRVGTVVAVRFLDGNMRRPVIMGVIPDHNAKGEAYCHKSYNGHELSFNRNGIILEHGESHNQIQFAQNINIQSQKGDVSYHADRNSVFTSGQDFIQRSQSDCSVAIHQDYFLRVKNNISYHAEKNITFSAENNFRLSTQSAITLDNHRLRGNAPFITVTGQRSVDIHAAQSTEIFAQEINVNIQHSLVIEALSVKLMGNLTGMLLNTPLLTINAHQISGIEMN